MNTCECGESEDITESVIPKQLHHTSLAILGTSLESQSGVCVVTDGIVEDGSHKHPHTSLAILGASSEPQSGVCVCRY